MQLEKALEEIEELRGQVGSECTSEDHYIKRAWEHCLDRVEYIIRKYMNDGWIPVEERLPEEPKENPEFEGKKIELYLVAVKGTKYPFRAMWNGKFFTDGWSKCNVIAWRPLPEPYRLERSESKAMRELGKEIVSGIKDGIHQGARENE